MREKVRTIDIEPLWIDIVKLWKEYDKKVSDDYIYPEIVKMAKVMDFIRQAQKKGKTLIIKDGNITEEK